MKKKYYLLLALIMLLIISACSNNEETKKEAQNNPDKEQDIEEKEVPDINEPEEPEEPVEEPSEPVTNPEIEEVRDEDGNVIISNPTDVHLVVNKQRRLPDGFKPEDLVVPNVPFSFDGWNEKKQIREIAAKPLEELFAAAKDASVDLVAVSGFRSFERQKTIYNYNVETNGLEHAKMYSAQPGHSEHQTGLSMDVSSVAVSFNLVEDFRQTEEGE
ncbi:LAS superfamily LD-carboxypeptidase LdcB [Salirhabdus euzebyi]|uniref:LAS superfamily LD-carboxypeptidase LdcB n=1 Tax=Salirhabdus euzebyi TaxID=394506 RepID=A0A841Q8P9_9BACI|nr:LAS superfamily LD-carboxypeptidase LdcB [Salirhabdus euzebyi]